MMVSASGGLVIGFHVDVPAQVSKTAEKENIDILKYTIIYMKKLLLNRPI